MRHLISTPLNSYPIKYPRNSSRVREIGTQFGQFPFVLHSKRSGFQDFQGYAKPSRLLPASEVKVWTDSSLEKWVTSFKEGRLDSLYKIKLRTSSFYGSALTDINAGILLCLVDENGESILQRIPSVSRIDHGIKSEDKAVSDGFHFQRGSVDEFAFVGPKLGKIQAVWVSLESGQWRLGGVSLSVISQLQPPLEESNEGQYDNLQYDFMIEDVLLGEGSEMSMVELRPRQVTKLCGDRFNVNESLSQSTSSGSSNISNEESMKEYTDLKLSLLLYDALIITAGSAIASFSAGENAAFAFLTGGMGGFVYLLLLQRSVDGLPSPASVSVDGTGILDKIFGRYKGQVTGLVLAVAFAVIAVKFGSEDEGLSLTPKDILLGMMGFLASKVAVVAAAFKPLLVSAKQSK